jgi:leader peptidase (prepilin peptidase)/N-methyltransferase
MGAFGWIMAVALAGLTASFFCVVLERGGVRQADGRSVCVCGTQIPMYRNIPVVSWLLQRGRAACCGARIPARYVLTEAGAVAAAVAGGLLAGFPGALLGIAGALMVTWVWHRRSARVHAE